VELQISVTKLKSLIHSLDKFTVKPKTGTVSVYSYIQFLFKNKNLNILACDGINCISTFYGEIEVEDFNCLVEYETLKNLMAYSESEECTFTFDEKQLKIKDGTGKYSLRYFGESDYSYLLDTVEKTLTKNVLFTITVKELNKIVSFLDVCIPSSGHMSFLKGINFDGNFTSTTGESLAVYPFSKKITNAVFISKDSLLKICALDNTASITAQASSSTLYITSDSFKCMVPLLAAKFPEYSKILNKIKKYQNKVLIKKAPVTKAFLRLLPFVSGTPKQRVQMSFTENTLALSSYTEGKDAVEELTPSTLEIQEDIEFIVDGKRMISLLSQIEDEDIHLFFSEISSEPIHFESESGAMYIEGVMVAKPSTPKSSSEE